jgi:integrase
LGTVSTNVYLRRIHNFALDMTWIARPLLPKRRWPKVVYKPKRGITWAEHQLVIGRENNVERKLYYELAWETGASQTDLANLTNDQIDRQTRMIVFSRQKIDGNLPPCRLTYEPGSRIDSILSQLPQMGPIFPYLRSVRPNDRSTEFWQRCKGLGIAGVSLHSYRYAWAERAKQAGYPERFAQAWLGHNSKAIHAAYAKGAEMVFPSLERWQKQFPTPQVLRIDFSQTSVPPVQPGAVTSKF